MKIDLMKLKTMFRLENWDIKILEVPTLETEAQCKMLYNDYKAVIQIKSELNEIEKRQSLIHEMLHIIHRDEFDYVAHVIENEKDYEYYLRLHERNIEKMAKIIHDNFYRSIR